MKKKRACQFCCEYTLKWQKKSTNVFAHPLSIYICDTCGSKNVFVNLSKESTINIFELQDSNKKIITKNFFISNKLVILVLMITKIGRVKILGLEFVFVGKYRYGKSKDETEYILEKHTDWRNWRIGLFFKRMKVVGNKNFSKPKKWGDNLIKQYMLGIDLLIVKGWFTVCRKGVMHLEIKD